MHDLEEIEETMANVEEKHDEGIQNHPKSSVSVADGSSTVQQVRDEDVPEGRRYADMLECTRFS